MQFTHNYTVGNKIKSLSNRLNFVAKDVNSSSHYIDSEVATDNLKFPYSHIISKIILQLRFKDRSKSEFQKTIRFYNKTNNTKLSFEEFDKRCWILMINDEVFVSEVIRSFIQTTDDHVLDGKLATFEENDKHLLKLEKTVKLTTQFQFKLTTCFG